MKHNPYAKNRQILPNCKNCNGSGTAHNQNDYGTPSHCRKCNGAGVQKLWICQQGIHSALDFDDLDHDPRKRPCEDCEWNNIRYTGWVEVLKEHDEAFLKELKKLNPNVDMNKPQKEIEEIRNHPDSIDSTIRKWNTQLKDNIAYQQELDKLVKSQPICSHPMAGQDLDFFEELGTKEIPMSEYMTEKGMTTEERAVASGEMDEFTAIKFSETRRGHLFFMVGLPRAGKSTLMNKWKAEKPNRVIICFDNIRLAMYEKDHLQMMEPFLWEFAQTMANTLLLSGYDVMMDDTHTSRWKRDYYKSLGGHGMYLNTPLDVCLRRAPQGHTSFLTAINRMAGRLESFDPEAENIALIDWKSL